MITPDLIAYLTERDSIYLATSDAEGQPYIQHRGGPKGFLKAIDDTHLAFADFAGNRQHITVGNLAENDRAFIFAMDYAKRRRIKIWGRARIVEGDAALLEKVRLAGYKARVERVIVFEVTRWDVNCPAHIPRKIDQASVVVLEARIAELEDQLASLRTANVSSTHASQ
jgi:predicted pyridoxine 5'-phosphate oxidase superfamily flavin-nucleotide-binding protein